MLRLTAACTPTDRIADLISGAVRPEGVDLSVLAMEPREVFRRIKWTREFDVGEMSLAQYILDRARGINDLVAIPAFTARCFRHGAIYVRNAGSVRTPSDLHGRRIGVPEYPMSAAVWARGLLSDQYHLDLDSIEWVVGGLRDPNRKSLIELDVPGVKLRAEHRHSLEELLLSGEIEAIISPQPPASFASRGGSVRRLFPNSGPAERSYFQLTGAFPIMHCVVIRTSLHEREPWLARSLFDAFATAKDNAIARLKIGEPLPIALPWINDAVRQTETVFQGSDWWPYGIEQNLPTLKALERYLEAQHLLDRQGSLLEFFASTVTRLDDV